MAADGGIVAVDRADEAPAGRRVLNQMYPLHSGYGLPAGYSLLVFVAGAGTLWLGWTGVRSWLRSEKS